MKDLARRRKGVRGRGINGELGEGGGREKLRKKQKQMKEMDVKNER